MRRYEDLRKAVRKLEYCQIGISSTPMEQHPFFIEFEDEVNSGNELFVRVVGSTAENLSLSKTYLEAEKKALRGSRRDNQEYFGILNRDNPGAYWNGQLLDECKDDLPTAYPPLPTDPANTFLMGLKPMPPNTKVIDGRLEYVDRFGNIDNGIYLVRVIIGFDPAIKKGNDECGIVVGYLYSNNVVYIVEDGSGQYHPNEWAQKIKDLYVKHNANGVVVETNQGGDMIENTLRTTFALEPKVDNLVVFDKFAKTSKEVRAEATAVYYAQGRVKHLKTANLLLLEKQMTSYNYQWTKSPDRIDALNMVCNELMFRSPLKKVKNLGQHTDLRDFSALNWSNK
jgi:phage terminase large subunit-like protein